MSKIGILAVSHPALGGTFQYTLSMIDALKRIPGNEYSIFTTSDNHHFEDLNLPVIRLPGNSTLLMNFIAARLLRLPTAEPFSGVDKIIAPIYTMRLLATRKPFAFTLHDLQERYFPQYFTAAQRAWRFSANTLLSRAASLILCESRFVKSDINKFLRVDLSRIEVVQAPPVSAFTADDLSESSLEKASTLLDLPSQFLFYPAQFFPHKNHLRLVDAFQRIRKDHPNCFLLFTGQKQHEYARVMARVSDLGLSDRVRHLGYVEASTLAAVYRLATLVVVPTLFESISIPIFEAFSVGAPVCASNVVALPEQVGDAGILFDPYSELDMASKISATLRNEPLRSELVKRGRRRIVDFSAAQYAQQLELVLGRII